MKTLMAVLLTVLIMLGLAGGGYYYINKQNQTDKKALQSQIDDLNAKLAAEKTSSTVTTATTATADWKTYKNDTYGFSFKYPGDIKTYSNSYGVEDTQKAADFYLTKTGNGSSIMDFETAYPNRWKDTDMGVFSLPDLAQAYWDATKKDQDAGKSNTHVSELTTQKINGSTLYKFTASGSLSSPKGGQLLKKETAVYFASSNAQDAPSSSDPKVIITFPTSSEISSQILSTFQFTK